LEYRGRVVQPSRREILAVGTALAAAPAWAACAGGGSIMSTPDSGLPGTLGKDTLAEGSASDDRVLRELLAWNRTRHPRYRGGLANHLSMALCSQHALGATPTRLSDFAARYGAMLDPLPEGGPTVDAAQWRSLLGRDEALRGLIAHFERDLKERGRETVLRDALDVLTPTLGSAAFHCLIRTAFGVRFDDDAEIAHGLAYWAVTNESLGELRAAGTSERDPLALLDRIRADKDLSGARITGGSISGRMAQASRLAGFADVAGALEVDGATLDRVARAVLALYGATGNFTALHAVTATHALRFVLPFASDRERLLRFHWQALTAAFVGIGAPRADSPVGDATTPWSLAVERAIASDDDHDAKLVFACLEEHALRGDDGYRLAATLRTRSR
jgi:hypothetical protein